MTTTRETAKSSRRQFISGVCTIAGITLLPSQCLAWEGPSDNYESAILQSAAKLLAEHELAIRIGKQYLRAASGPQSQSELVDWLQTRIDMTAGTRDGIFKNIETRILDDFSEDNIVVMQGWWLSETEVRMCALATVSAGIFS